MARNDEAAEPLKSGYCMCALTEKAASEANKGITLHIGSFQKYLFCKCKYAAPHFNTKWFRGGVSIGEAYDLYLECCNAQLIEVQILLKSAIIQNRHPIKGNPTNCKLSVVLRSANIPNWFRDYSLEGQTGQLSSPRIFATKYKGIYPRQIVATIQTGFNCEI